MSGSGRAGECGGGRAALPAFATAGPGGAEMPPQKSRIPPPAPGAVLPVGAPRGHLLATGTALGVGERGRGGRRAGFTGFWPPPTFASVRVLIIAFNRDKEQLLMMLPLILTCSCPSSAAALPRRSPANWESCSAYCGLPADGGGGGADGRAGPGEEVRAPVAGPQGQNRGGGLHPKRGWSDGSSPSSPRRGGAQRPRAAAGSAEEQPLPPHAGGGLGWSRPLLRPSPAFDLQRSLAGGRPSGRPSQAAGTHLAVSPLFGTTFSPRRRRGQKRRVWYRTDRLQSRRPTQS